jgi:hypothetical protein
MAGVECESTIQALEQKVSALDSAATVIGKFSTPVTFN